MGPRLRPRHKAGLRPLARRRRAPPPRDDAPVLRVGEPGDDARDGPAPLRLHEHGRDGRGRRGQHQSGRVQGHLRRRPAVHRAARPATRSCLQQSARLLPRQPVPQRYHHRQRPADGRDDRRRPGVLEQLVRPVRDRDRGDDKSVGQEFVGDLINTSLYKFTKNVFEKLPLIQKSVRGEYEITDVISLLAQERNVKVKILKDNWMDFGRPEDLEKFSGLIKNGNH